MGALRVGKLARYLLSRGHDTRVLSARDLPRPQTLPQDFPEDRVVRTPWWDVNKLPKTVARWLRGRNKAAARNPDPAPGPGPSQSASAQAGGRAAGSLRSALSGLYTNLVNFPDAYVGWVPPSVAAGRRMLKAWLPDLIFATGPPFTALIAARILARSFRVPWVIEFRDRWSDDPYYPPPAWRQWLERTVERRLIGSAAALVTVSEPWAHVYRQTYGKPTVTIFNGFDPADFPEAGTGAPEPGVLRIVHTGRIYPGRRDPSPLFEAVSQMDQAQDVRMVFLGAEASSVAALAERHGVTALVETHPHVPYAEALAAQRQADILLFMQWNDPQEQGNVPGKLFEYLAVRRPILGLGLEDGVPASIIRDRSAGVFCNDPRGIAGHLSQWLAEKREKGRIEPLPESVRAGFARDEQFTKLETVLYDVCRTEAG